MNEFVIEWLRYGEYAGVTAPPGTALKNKILKLAEKRPNEVKIIAKNEDGSIFAHIPINYIKISPPREVSDEQREKARQRFKEMQAKKKNEGKSDETEEDDYDEDCEDLSKTLAEYPNLYR